MARETPSAIKRGNTSRTAVRLNVKATPIQAHASIGPASEQGVQMTGSIGSPPPILAVPTSIALFVGWSPSGPNDHALRVTSLGDFERSFGALDQRSLLGYGLWQFFENGGTQAYVLRLADASGAAIGPADEAFLAALRAAFAVGGPIDQIDLFDLICVPGLTDAASIAMLQAYAGVHRAFLIADCAETDTAAGIGASLTGKTGADARNAAFYFPWVVAPDPLQTDTQRAFPPCGFVAGVFARTDNERGVWRAPAGNGAHLVGATDLTVHLNDAAADPLNRQGINCLRSFPNVGIVVYGSRTLAGADGQAPDWRYVPVRRMALFIEQSVQSSTKWAVFEPNAEPLWAMLRSTVTSFMDGLFKQGAFQGNTPALAYFVRCDGTTTTQADIDNGVVNIVIGFAALRPGEFIVLQSSQRVGMPS